MKERDLPFDRSKHALYTQNAKKCVQRLLRRCYDGKTAAELWEKVQLRYCEYLKDEPALKDLKITTSIYDPILIFAWYAVAPDKPPMEEVQRQIYECFFGAFGLLGRIFDLNRKTDNALAWRIFRKANDIRVEEIRRFPASFRMGGCSYDRENGIVRYSFTQCPQCGIRQAPSHGGCAPHHVQLRSPGHAGHPRGADPGGDLLYGPAMRLLYRR